VNGQGPLTRALSAVLAPPLRLVGAVGLAVMALVTLADIVGRAVLRLPVPGVVEIVELALACSTFAGIALAFLRGEHVAVELLDGAPRIVRRLLDVLTASAVVALLVLLVWLMRDDVADALEFGDSTAVLGLPVAWALIAVVAGFAASALALVARGADALLDLLRG
jgi:TRAP-type C4-dicarboxylate transport system permease small subunit